ncbi:MAG: TRAP transporter substrate-binding protein DctP [Betaproteobacteria bacterium]|nr:TRAP transporter substrate-binding protein DctP [Betaproteobacteria bacterium]
MLDGSVDIALGLRGAEGDRFPGTSLIELPFLVQDSSSGSRALWQLYTGGALDGEYRDYKVLALFVHDPGLIHTKEKRVETLADLKGLRLRAPNNTVAEALKYVGATPVILQVNEVMPAVQRGEVDGIVTNWANPLPDFNAHMKKHADTKFYTSAFFVLMNRARYAGLPVEQRAAIDELNAGTMAAWREGLRPVSEKYVADLAAGKFPAARETYRRLLELSR